VDAHGMPVRVLVTACTVADCTQGSALIDGIFAEWLMGDKGYDSNTIIAKAQEAEYATGYSTKEEQACLTRI
jgi:hypothetical protein